MRMPKPLEARILLVLAAAVTDGRLAYLSAEEILAALGRDGHHPTPNVFRRALAAMDAAFIISKRVRLADGRIYDEQELETAAAAGWVKEEAAGTGVTAYVVGDWYMQKLAGEFLDEGEQPPALTPAAREAVERFYRNAYGRTPKGPAPELPREAGAGAHAQAATEPDADPTHFTEPRVEAANPLTGAMTLNVPGYGRVHIQPCSAGAIEGSRAIIRRAAEDGRLPRLVVAYASPARRDGRGLTIRALGVGLADPS